MGSQLRRTLGLQMQLDVVSDPINAVGDVDPEIRTFFGFVPGDHGAESIKSRVDVIEVNLGIRISH